MSAYRARRGNNNIAPCKQTQLEGVHTMTMCSEAVWRKVVTITTRFVDVMQWVRMQQRTGPPPDREPEGVLCGLSLGGGGGGPEGAGASFPLSRHIFKSLS